jgi:hypothetical protein
MVLSPFKLVLSLSNFASYLICPLTPLYLAFMVETAELWPVQQIPLQLREACYAGRQDVLSWIQNEEVLMERKIVVCIVVYLFSCFFQFHVLRYLFTLHLPGLVLKRQKVQKEVVLQSIFWLLSLLFLVLAAPSYYGAVSMWSDLISPKFAFR